MNIINETNNSLWKFVMDLQNALNLESSGILTSGSKADLGRVGNAIADMIGRLPGSAIWSTIGWYGGQITSIVFGRRVKPAAPFDSDKIMRWLAMP